MYFNSGSFKIDTSDIQKKFNKFEKALNDPSGVFTKTLGDMQRRAPGKVADAVRNIYNINFTDDVRYKQREAYTHLLRTQIMLIAKKLKDDVILQTNGGQIQGSSLMILAISQWLKTIETLPVIVINQDKEISNQQLEEQLNNLLLTD